jgi:hypothetical protein
LTEKEERVYFQAACSTAVGEDFTEKKSRGSVHALMEKDNDEMT